jgi:hypothetical protein
MEGLTAPTHCTDIKMAPPSRRIFLHHSSAPHSNTAASSNTGRDPLDATAARTAAAAAMQTPRQRHQVGLHAHTKRGVTTGGLDSCSCSGSCCCGGGGGSATRAAVQAGPAGYPAAAAASTCAGSGRTAGKPRARKGQLSISQCGQRVARRATRCRGLRQLRGRGSEIMRTSCSELSDTMRARQRPPRRRPR